MIDFFCHLTVIFTEHSNIRGNEIIFTWTLHTRLNKRHSVVKLHFLSRPIAFETPLNFSCNLLQHKLKQEKHKMHASVMGKFKSNLIVKSEIIQEIDLNLSTKFQIPFFSNFKPCGLTNLQSNLRSLIFVLNLT